MNKLISFFLLVALVAQICSAAPADDPKPDDAAKKAADAAKAAAAAATTPAVTTPTPPTPPTPPAAPPTPGPVKPPANPMGMFQKTMQDSMTVAQDIFSIPRSIFGL